ncbi:TetR/AcrR family transcriptional regulator [Algoriphagus kandeliae]|uniref:TetR/AcrR family transcriptional regulator n=1 Tax=Algoriphagus kandeliae TaxID=2562278 RepID=A0A4Y9QQS3_9BACT|nr:TetR/AcrR family transcriptional regulator [Algoriphagus kandeliae]TFV94567.1 TetR/AcrR family transcriptional regulator [Algoriphagus kandeliae]
MTQGAKDKWIEAAYSEFALSGPEFSLNALAEKSKLPRASLYYHFDSKEALGEELLIFHQKKINSYLSELKKEVKDIVPDLYKVMYANKEGILFHRQLLLHRDQDEFLDIYKKGNNEALTILLPHIKQLFRTTGSDEDLIQFYHTLTDTWYIRVNPNDFNVENMISVAMEIMENTLGLFSGLIIQKTR